MITRLLAPVLIAGMVATASMPRPVISHELSPPAGAEDALERSPSRLRIIPPDDADALAEPCDAGIPDVGLGFARILEAGGSGLRVRSGPGREFGSHLILRNGAKIVVLSGPRHDVQNTAWFEIASAGGERVHGWTNGEFLTMLPPCVAMHEPDTGGRSIIQARVMAARITAYTYQEPGNGAHGWITRSGLPVRWGLVAVDPTIIPLGSLLSIEGFNDVFLAADTGFGVIGQHIDIFFEELDDAVQFGVQYREIVVLN